MPDKTMHENGKPFKNPVLKLSGDRKLPVNMRVLVKDVKIGDSVNGHTVESIERFGDIQTMIHFVGGLFVSFPSHKRIDIIR